MSDFCKYVKGLGWKHGLSYIEVPEKEKVGFYGRDWAKRVPLNVVWRDFLEQRENLIKGGFSYMVMIYIPRIGLLPDQLEKYEASHSDKFEIISVDVERRLFTRHLITPSIVMNEFSKFLRERYGFDCNDFQVECFVSKSDEGSILELRFINIGTLAIRPDYFRLEGEFHSLQDYREEIKPRQEKVIRLTFKKELEGRKIVVTAWGELSSIIRVATVKATG